MVCIGVIGAMEEEVASLINQMEDAESKTMESGCRCCSEWYR